VIIANRGICLVAMPHPLKHHGFSRGYL
jgi:hypothetical protein